MRISLKYFLALAAVGILVAPMWARTSEMDLTVDHPVMVGTTKIQPGEYQIKADDSKDTIQILRDGNVVATAQGHWTKLAKKADNSEAEYNTDRLTQLDFEGSAQAFQLN